MRASFTYNAERVIGNGKPGPVTKKLVKAYKELTKVNGEPIAKR